MQEFRFTDCVEIKELLGKKADDEQELMELIEEVPADSIYYHIHSCFLRHRYIAGAYPNDFAEWAAIQVRDKVLSGMLSCVTPSPKTSLDDIRSDLIDVIDKHLSSISVIPKVICGKPFYFMKSRIIEVPTRLVANDLNGFKDLLKVVDTSAIYNHIFEARLRVRKGRSDFAIWLEEVLGFKELAEKIEKIDAYMYSLEGLRGKILFLCSEAIAGKIH